MTDSDSDFVIGGIIVKEFPWWRYRCVTCRSYFKTEKGARKHWERNGGRLEHLMIVPSVAVERNKSNGR